MRAKIGLVIAVCFALLVAGCSWYEDATPPVPKDEHDVLVELQVALISSERVFTTMIFTGVLNANKPDHVDAVVKVNAALNEAKVNFQELRSLADAGRLDVNGDKLILTQNLLAQVAKILAKYGGQLSGLDAGDDIRPIFLAAAEAHALGTGLRLPR
jgi:hypothetical protein